MAVVLDGDRFLVIRRSQHVRAPGMYCFPGGAIEPDETESGAVVREMQEELSAAVRPVRRLWESVTPWQVHLAWWLVELVSEAPLLPQPAEVESFHWLTAAEIRGMADVLASNLEFLAMCGPDLPTEHSSNVKACNEPFEGVELGRHTSSQGDGPCP